MYRLHRGPQFQEHPETKRPVISPRLNKHAGDDAWLQAGEPGLITTAGSPVSGAVCLCCPYVLCHLAPCSQYGVRLSSRLPLLAAAGQKGHLPPRTRLFSALALFSLVHCKDPGRLTRHPEDGATHDDDSLCNPD